MFRDAVRASGDPLRTGGSALAQESSVDRKNPGVASDQLRRPIAGFFPKIKIFIGIVRISFPLSSLGVLGALKLRRDVAVVGPSLEQHLERLDQAIMDVIDNPVGTQKTLQSERYSDKRSI